MNLLQRHVHKFNSPNQAEFTYIFVLFFYNVDDIG